MGSLSDDCPFRFENDYGADSKPKPQDVKSKQTAIRLLIAFMSKLEDIREKLAASSIPLEIAMNLNAFYHELFAEKRITPQIYMVFMNNLNALVDNLTGFERILRTPIPLAYSIHLSQVVWIYLIALPFQFVDSLKWTTVAVVAICAFTFFGIESIGGQIENPFGYDENDLPLDDFVEILTAELNLMSNQRGYESSNWILDDEDDAKQNC